MPSIADNAHATARRAQSSVRGVAVTYTRPVSDGPDLVIDITGAVRGNTNHDSRSPFPGSRVADRSVDWTIEASQLVDGGTQLEPKRGDTITDDTGAVYKAMPNGSDSPLWMWSSPGSRSHRRIFTKERN